MARLSSLHRLAAAVFLTVAVSISWPSWADEMDQVRKLRSNEVILPLSQILQSIETNYPGTLLDVELEYEDNLLIYEIEILSHDNHIQHIEVNARTGELLPEDHE